MPDLADTLDYGRVSDLHRALSEKSPFFAGQQLPEFSHWANELTGTQRFAAGLEDNHVKQLSHWLDRQLAPVSKATGQWGHDIGAAIGPTAAGIGESVGKGLPRGLVNMAPLAAGPLGIPATAALQGAQSYTDTGSKLAGLIGGVSAAALPASAAIGEAVASKGLRSLFYTPFEEAGVKVAQAVPSMAPGAGMLERLGEAAGRQIGMAVNQELATQATSLATTGHPYGLTSQHLAEVIGSQLPFAALEIPGVVRTPKLDINGRTVAGRSNTELRALADIGEAKKEVDRYIQQGVPATQKVGPESTMQGKTEQQMTFLSDTGDIAEGILKEGVKASAAMAKLTKRAETAKFLNGVTGVDAADLAKLDPEYVKELTAQGVLEAQKDGTLMVKKQIPVSAEDLVTEALNKGPVVSQNTLVVNDMKRTVFRQTPSGVGIPTEEETGRQFPASARGGRATYQVVEKFASDPEIKSLPEMAGYESVKVGGEPTPEPKPAYNLGPKPEIAAAPATEGTMLERLEKARTRLVEETKGDVAGNVLPATTRRILGKLDKVITVLKGQEFVEPDKAGYPMVSKEVDPLLAAAKSLNPQPGAEEAGSMLFKQLQGLVDEATMARLERPVHGDVPLDIRLTRLAKVRDVLQQVVGQAVKGHEVEPAAFTQFGDAMEAVHQRSQFVPLEQAMNEAYNATLAHVAKLTRALKQFNDETENKFGAVFEGLDKEILGQGLAQLETVPHGTSVLKALADVLSGQVFARVSGKSFQKADVGTVEDATYYHLIHKATLLASEGSWKKALVQYSQRHPSEVIRYGQDIKTNNRLDQAVAREFILKPEKSQPYDETTSELIRMASLNELADRAGVTIGELDLKPLVEQSDPLQQAKVEAAKEWFGATFTRPMTLEEWNQAGTLELVFRNRAWENKWTGGEALQGKYKFQSKDAQVQLAKTFNTLMEMFRSGELELRHTRQGFEVKTPEDIQATLVKLGKSPGATIEQAKNNWKGARTTVIASLVERLNAMFERWSLATATPENVIQMEPKGMERAPREGTMTAEGSFEAAKALRGPLPSDKRAMAAGAKQWFREFFADRGASGPMVEAYAELASKVALAFEDVGYGKIGTIIDPALAGQQLAFHTKRLVPYLVGLNKTDIAYGDMRVQAAMLLHTVGHEMFHGVMREQSNALLTPEQVKWKQQALDSATALTPEQRVETMKLWQDVVYPHAVQVAEPMLRSDLDQRLRVIGHDPEEYLADLAGMALTGLVRPDKETSIKPIHQYLLMSDAHTQQFLKGFFVPLFDVVKGLGSWFMGTRPEMAKHVATAATRVEALLKTSKEIDAAANALRQMELHEPENYNNLVQQGYLAKPWDAGEVFKALGLADPVEGPVVKNSVRAMLNKAGEWLGVVDSDKVQKAFGVSPGWLQKTFWTAAQLAHMYPALRGPLDVVMSFRPMATDLANKLLMPMMVSSRWKGQTLDVKGTGMQYVLDHPEASKAFTEIALREQTQGAMSDAEMRAAMPRLGKEGHDRVIDYRHATKAVMGQARPMIVKQLSEQAMHPAAQMLLTGNAGMKVKDARDVATQITQASWNASDPDPAKAQLGQQALAALMQSGVATPKSMMDTIAATQALHKPVRDFEQRTAGNDTFMSEIRLGRYYVAYTNPKAVSAVDKTGLAAFDTKQEAVEWSALESQRTGVSLDKFNHWDKWTREDHYSGMNPDFVKTLQEIEQAALMHGVTKMGLTAQTSAQVLGAYVPMEAALRELHSSGNEKYLLERKIRAGRETLDQAHGFLYHVNALSTGLAKRYVKGEIGLALADPELRANPELLKLATDHFNNVVNPPSAEWSFLKRLNFAYFLGFNPSSMLVEATQPALSLAPHLTQETGSLTAGYKYWGTAIRDMVALATKGTTGSAMLDKGLADARKAGRVDFGVMQETHDAETIASLNLRNMMKGGEGLMTPINMGMKALDQYGMVARWLYSYAPRFTSNLAFLASYRAASEHGVLSGGVLKKLGHDEAYDFAIRSLETSMYTGGIAARPVGMFTDLGRAHGAVGLAYSLGSYSLGMVSQMARLGLQSIGNSAMSGAEKSAARKAFGQMMFTQTALAGAMGLPMVAFTMTALNQLFPTLEPRKAVEDGLRSLAGDDDDTGGLISDLAMRGVPTKMFGFDLGSRLGLASIMGVNGYDGLSLAGLVGPVGSIANNVIKATQYGTSGQMPEAIKSLVPQPMKAAVDLYSNDGVLRDKQGRVLVQPTQNEAAMYAMGFKPTRLTELRDKQEMIQQHENVVKLQDQAFNKKVADMVEGGDIGGARAALLERQGETNGLYLATRGAVDIADEVIKRAAPFDIARSGTRLGSAERQRLAAQAGERDTWTEMQRLEQKKRLETVLGVPGAGAYSKTEVKRASLMDQLMGANPMLGRAEAGQMVDLMLGRRQPVPQ